MPSDDHGLSDLSPSVPIRFLCDLYSLAEGGIIRAARWLAMSRNSNFYEVALVGPDCPNAVAPVYRCGYSDQLDCIVADGMVPVPDGVGLGVDYDWDFIERNRTAHLVYR